MAIGTLAWNLVVKHRGVTEGLTATRKEFNTAAKIAEKYSDEQTRLSLAQQMYGDLLKKGLILQHEYDAEMADFTRTLHENSEEFKRRQEIMRRGQATTLANETATETYERELAKLNEELKEGAITQATYNRAVAKARAPLEGAAKSSGLMAGVMARLDPRLVALAAGAGAVAVAMRGVRSVIDGTREAYQTLDDTTKKARLFGAAIDELRALRNAGLQFANVSSRDVDLAVQRMTRRIAEAANGTGEAKSAIEELGLSAQELSLAGPFRAFGMLADRIREIPDEGTRLRYAFKFFDSEGAKLANVFHGGSEALREQLNLLDRYGLSISSLDTAAIEASNDNWAMLDTLITGVFEKFAVEFAPLTAVLADKLLNAGEEGVNLGKAIESIASYAAFGIGTAIDYANQAIGIFRVLGGTIQTVLGYLTGQDVTAAINEISAGWQQALSGGRFETSTGLQKDIDALKASFAEAGTAARDTDLSPLIDQFDEVATAATHAADVVRGIYVPGLGIVDRSTYDEFNKGTEAIREQIAVFQYGAEAVEAYKLRMGGVTEAMVAERRALEAIKAEYDKQQAALDERNKLMERGKELMMSTETAGQRFARQIADISKLLRVGAIDERTYRRERERLIDAELKGQQAQLNTPNRAILAGSAESQAIDAQRLRDRIASEINAGRRAALERSASAVTRDVVTKGDKFVAAAIDKLGRVVESTKIEVKEFDGGLL